MKHHVDVDVECRVQRSYVLLWHIAQIRGFMNVWFVCLVLAGG